MRRAWLGLSVALLVAGACGGDSGKACYLDGECPVHQYCQAPTGTCVSGCLADSDCPGQSCDPHGRCVATSSPVDGAGAGAAQAIDLGAPDLGADLSSAEPDLGRPPVDLAIADAWICTGTCPDYKNEPNGTAAKATAIAANTTVTNLAICPKGDVDLYKLPGGKAGTLVATVTNGPCGSGVQVDLLDSDGTTTIGTSTTTAAGGVARARVSAKQSPYVRVQAASAGGQNFYTLVVALQ